MDLVENILIKCTLSVRPCSEEVITSLFQGGVSGALPDWAAIPTYEVIR